MDLSYKSYKASQDPPKILDTRLHIHHSFVPAGRVDLAVTREKAILMTRRENRTVIVHKHAAPATVIENGKTCPPEMYMDEEHHEIYNGGELVPDFIEREGGEE